MQRGQRAEAGEALPNSATRDATIQQLTADRDELNEKLGKLEEWKTEQLFEQAMADGRCTLAEKDLFLKNVEMMGEADAYKVFKKGRVKLGARAPREARDPQAELADGDSKHARVKNLAAKYQDEHGMDALSALQAAMDEAASEARDTDPADDYQQEA